MTPAAPHCSWMTPPEGPSNVCDVQPQAPLGAPADCLVLSASIQISLSGARPRHSATRPARSTMRREQGLPAPIRRTGDSGCRRPSSEFRTKGASPARRRAIDLLQRWSLPKRDPTPTGAAASGFGLRSRRHVWPTSLALSHERRCVARRLQGLVSQHTPRACDPHRPRRHR